MEECASSGQPIKTLALLPLFLFLGNKESVFIWKAFTLRIHKNSKNCDYK